MAIIQCTECKTNISDTAERCPSCGAKTMFLRLKEGKRKGIIMLSVIIVVSLIVVRVWYVDKQMQENLEWANSPEARKMQRDLKEIEKLNREIEAWSK